MKFVVRDNEEAVVVPLGLDRATSDRVRATGTRGFMPDYTRHTSTSLLQKLGALKIKLEHVDAWGPRSAISG